LLVAYAEASPEAGEQEINRLIETYPSQRGSALKARTILLARQCGRLSRLTEVSELAARLPKVLADTSPKRDACEKRSTRSPAANAAGHGHASVLPRTLARALVAEISGFQGKIAGFREPLATEFRNASQAWLTLAQRQYDDARTVLAKSRTPQLFRAGDPVDRSQEAFVERNEVVGEVEVKSCSAPAAPD